jgi:putative methyltransferase (TIGR04325 family)
MNLLKNILKNTFSDTILSKIAGISYGWHGNFKSWDIAKKKCTGYDETAILEKVLYNSLRVKNGEIPFEQDSVPFEKKKYSFPVLAALMWIAVRKNNKLNILDFGGSLGTSYYQNIDFLNCFTELNWCIVEQAHFVKTGQEHFANNNLHFFYTINDCISIFNIDAILLSSVLPYVEKPYSLLDEIISKEFEYIIIDRMLLVNNSKDRLTIQKVPRKIYKASYCCWFLSEAKFLGVLSKKYDLIYDFEIPGSINIKSLYKGYVFKLRKEI